MQFLSGIGVEFSEAEFDEVSYKIEKYRYELSQNKYRDKL